MTENGGTGTQHTCDYCRAVIDVSRPDAMIVSVNRRVDGDEWGDDSFVSGDLVQLRFCHQRHAADYLARTALPQGTPAFPMSNVTLVTLIVGVLLVLGLAAYGAVELWREAVSTR